MLLAIGLAIVNAAIFLVVGNVTGRIDGRGGDGCFAT